MRLALGQPIRVSTEVRDIALTLMDPTTIVLTVKRPDGSTQIFTTPTQASVGKYYLDISATDLPMLGHYSFAWATTGPGAGVSPPGDFDVYDPFEASVLPLQDAKDALNIAQTNTAYDNEIAIMVASVESALERITGGPLLTSTVVERVKVSHGYRSLVLRRRPVVDVQSIIDIAGGIEVDTGDLDVDANSGIVRRVLEQPFWSRGPYYTVTYTAGWGTSIPSAFNLAARVILAHLWEIQQGPGVRPSMGGGDMTRTYRDTGLGFAIPNRAMEIMSPYASEVSL